MDTVILKEKTDVDLINHRIRLMGLRQGFVAKQIGISGVHLSGVLNNKRTLTDELRERLFSYLQIKRGN